MKVWLSRSRPGADRQAADLAAAGHEPVVAPVVVIEPQPADPPAGPFESVIFLSEHAVRLGLPRVQPSSWFPAARVFAVGARTARCLEERGVPAHVPEADATSEGLLALPELTRLGGRRMLLVAGVGGRELLGEELRRRGAEVARLECYRRVPVERLDPAVRDCEVLIAASGEGLRRAAQLWRAAGGRPDLPVLVPSFRVAALGVELGLTNLHDCGGADSEAWLRGLARLGASGAR